MKFDEGPRKAVRAKVKAQKVNPEAGAAAFFRGVKEIMDNLKRPTITEDRPFFETLHDIEVTTVDRCPHCGEIKILYKGECFCNNHHCFFGEDLEL